MQVSLVIPCFKEEDRLPFFLKELHKRVLEFPEVEFLIVDDGTPQKFFFNLREKLSPYLSEQIRLFHYEVNLGKGNAISYGLTHAKGQILGFVDSDGAIPAMEVFRLIQYIQSSPRLDLLAGSRILMLGKRVERGLKRHLSNRIFATYFSNLFGIKMYDSQCGIKLFKREAYESIKEKITDKRWLWDTQLIVQFHRNGFLMEEIPIDWSDQPGSKVSLIKDSFRMFFKLLQYKLDLKKDDSML